MPSLSQLVPDVREALQQGLEEAVQDVATEVRRRGPYWDGTFANNWIVQPGRRAIRPIIPTFPNVATRPRPRPATWQELDLPASPNLAGYTLGNRTTYRLYAMDLAPSGRWGSIYRGDTKNSTAPKFWYTTYINNVMPRTIDNAFRSVFRRFK